MKTPPSTRYPSLTSRKVRVRYPLFPGFVFCLVGNRRDFFSSGRKISPSWTVPTPSFQRLSFTAARCAKLIGSQIVKQGLFQLISSATEIPPAQLCGFPPETKFERRIPHRQQNTSLRKGRPENYRRSAVRCGWETKLRFVQIPLFFLGLAVSVALDLGEITSSAIGLRPNPGAHVLQRADHWLVQE
jgi:hypothetical protein